MLKKIIKTHTARLDFVDIIKPTFLRNAIVYELRKMGDLENHIRLGLLNCP